MFNIPNSISLLRLFLVPFFLYFLLLPDTLSRWIALGIFVVATVTDWLDGYLARKLNQISTFGKFIDPLVDKVLVLAALVGLTYGQEVSIWATFIILTREFLVTGLRVVAAEKGIVIAAETLGKWKTATQMAAIILILLNLAPWGWLFLWLAVILTVVSGAEYFWKARGVFQQPST